MSPRARGAGDAAQLQRVQDAARPTVSIALPGEIHHHVHEAPPALVSPDVNAAHVGLSRNALADVLRIMRADAAFADRVIVLSRKRVAAAPEDVIRFMRQRYSATARTPAPSLASVEHVEHEDDGIDHALLARAGRRLKPSTRRATR